MIYSFFCKQCQMDVEVDRIMAEAGHPAECSQCHTPMQRRYTHAFICDEIRGTRYLHPKLCKEVTDHGKYFDHGGGFWVHSKQERRNEIAKRNLGEIGGSQV